MINLVRSPYKTDSRCPPINLLTLASYIEPHYDVTITDLVISYMRGEMTLDEEGVLQAAKQILESPAPVIGFTAMCSSYAAGLRIARECKRLDPSRIIVFGGPHAGFVDEETLTSFDFVDVIVKGEGELTLLELLNAIESGQSIEGIRGLAYRTEGGIKRTPPREVIDHLDDLPIPSYHLIKNIDDYYENEAERFIEIEAGRGCPFLCKFCSTSVFFSRKYRVKSPEKLIAEMKWLKEHWGITLFGLIHDNLTVNKKKVTELCEEFLRSGESFSWFCSSRTDTIDYELMKIMKQSGCRGIFFGVETGSQEMQKNVGKRLKLENALQTFHHLAEMNIEATASFIIGFPEENVADLEDTLTLALQLRLVGIRDIQLHPLTALPGTEVFDEYVDQILFDKEMLYFHDITSVIDITDVEMEWVQKHRKIFSNFYAVPTQHYPLELVYQIRGSYFYLVHYRPRTLYMMLKMVEMTNIQIVQLLVKKLSTNFRDWTPEELLYALGSVVNELPVRHRGYVRDVLQYEEAYTSTVEFTDGANGWVRFKGEEPVNTKQEPKLKPARTVRLQYDVLSGFQNILEDIPVDPPEYDHHLAVVFEWTNKSLRTLEIDPLTAEIIERTKMGQSLIQIIHELSEENPYLHSTEDVREWKASILTHLSQAGLIMEDGSMAVSR